MSTEQNKAIALRFAEEVINKYNLAAVDELFDSSYVNHFIPPGQPQGPQGEKQLNATFHDAFPDAHLTVEDMIAEGDKAVARWTYRGTQTGEFMGIAPTGKQVTFTGITVFRYANGKIAENWTSADTLGLLQQLGAIPSMG